MLLQDKVVLITGSTTGIEISMPELTNYKVYTRNRLLFVEGELDYNTQLSLYDINGRMFYRDNAKDLNRNSIDVTGLPIGIYLLQIEKKGNSQTHKVVITRN